MFNENKITAILEGLRKIPQGTRVLHVSTPCVWLIYIEISPVHCYYIIKVDKPLENEEGREIK